MRQIILVLALLLAGCGIAGTRSGGDDNESAVRQDAKNLQSATDEIV